MKTRHLASYRFINGLIFLAIFTFCSSAFAVELRKGVYLGANVVFHQFDNDTKLDNRFGLSLDAGYQFNKSWAAEYYYEVTATKDQSENDVQVDYAHINAIYNLESREDDVLIPFLQFGFGKAKYKYTTSPIEKLADDNSVDLGVGFKFIVTPSVQLRTDIRLIHAGEDAFNMGVVYGIGTVYAFGAPKIIPPPAPVWVEPEVKKVEPIKPVAVLVVKEEPKDGDKDGVLDNDDQCLDSKPNAVVDAKGCEKVVFVAKEFVLDVKFKTGSSVLDPSTKGSISDLAKFLAEFTETNVVIEGHTDSMGSAASNKVLSQKRADAVRVSLISDFGTEASRVTSVGFGKEQPIADNATEAGRAQNRRVVAKVKAMPRAVK